jgi:hypothetical protein
LFFWRRPPVKSRRALIMTHSSNQSANE